MNSSGETSEIMALAELNSNPSPAHHLPDDVFAIPQVVLTTTAHHLYLGPTGQPANDGFPMSSLDVSYPYAADSMWIRKLDVARAFGDSMEKKVLTDFCKVLLEKIGNVEDLKGVQFGLRVYPWEDMDEERVRLIRVELRVPGISGAAHKSVWSEYSRLFVESSEDFIGRVGKTTPVGRQFRRLTASLSKGVVPL